MVSFRERTRFASLVAIGLALLVSGVVTGAAGGNFILGQANSAGTSNTSLTTSSTGNALLVTQNGTGTAIRGSTGSGSGIAGFFTSGSGSGVSGVVANQNSYGVYAANDSGTNGTGAALRVQGGVNDGVVATTTGGVAITGLGPDNAIVATSTGCTGFICFGGNGVSATGSGIFSSGVSASGYYGVYGSGSYGTFGAADALGEIGAYGSNAAGTGVYGAGLSAATITGCGVSGGLSWACSGGRFTGSNGVVAVGGASGGVAVIAQGFSTSDLGLLVSGSDARIEGNLTVTGTCTGCTLASTAQNGGSSTLHQGDAVTLVGAKASPLGDGLVLVVRAAKGNDTVLGIMGAATKLAPESVTVPASSSTVTVPGVGEQTTVSKQHTMKTQGRTFFDSGTSAANGGYLRVITSGIVEAAAADAGSSAIKAGDALALGANGKLSKKADADRTVGFALKGLDAGTGKIAVLLLDR